MREREAAIARRDDLQARWTESERIQTILRTIQPTTAPITEEIISEWYASLESRSFNSPTGVDAPSSWFHLRFPYQAEVYGPSLLEESHSTAGGVTGICRPVYLNTDFFGAVLGGDHGLGQQTVYYPPEATFYFYDIRAKAFCPASEHKMQVLASNYLVKCAESCSGRVDTRPLIQEFRKPHILREITTKAKAIFQADRSFFEGPQGKARYVDGYRINPQDEPAHQLFIKGIQARPGSRLTVAEAYERYAAFCRRLHVPALASAEFKKTMPQIIEATYGNRLRHDVPDPTGKHQHGWVGLACPEAP